MNADSDTPKFEHYLGDLWKTASPIAKSFNKELKEDHQRFVDEVIDGYNTIDYPGTHLRYPSDKNNKPIKHPKYLQSFSKNLHTKKFQRASNALDAVITSMEIKKIFYFDLDMPYNDIDNADFLLALKKS